ncbi:MAG: polyprenyl synthetase family protein [Acutalibacteraceae bacterium]
MSNNIQIIEEQLDKYLQCGDCREQSVIDSMRYSLEAGGKRIRPTLALEFCKLCGGSIQQALPFACAVEMVHTYSLIHDDLPCMDDDDVRRGRPSNHIKFGEATALLAGDALQALAFEVMLSEQAISLVGPDKAARAAAVLAKCIGAHGMVGGQMIDLSYEGKHADIEVIKDMYAKKTGELIIAACEMGCIVGGASDKQIASAHRYAESIGLAFQIVDDILDVTSDEATLGKPIGSDEENEKSTFVLIYGLERCKKIVNELTEDAVNALADFDADVSYLRDLAYSLAQRNN